MAKWSEGAGLIAALLVTAGLAGCSEPEQESFSGENKDAFLAACVDPLDDSALIADVCGCVYDRALEQYTDFNDFVAVDDLLSADPEQELPQELIDVMAGCFIVEAEL